MDDVEIFIDEFVRVSNRVVWFEDRMVCELYWVVWWEWKMGIDMG